MWYKWFYRAPLFLILFSAVLLLMGYVVMLLWNALIPALFQGPVLTFWQTVGIVVLIKILLHGHNCRPWYHSGWHAPYHKSWKHKFEKKLASMSPEEREKFKEEWSKRCNPKYWNHHHFDSDQNDSSELQ